MEGLLESRTRRCIVSGDILPEGKIVRFVADPAGAVVPDITAKLPGRGLWVHADAPTIARAVERNAFSRAAKAPLSAPADLPQRVETLLSRHMLAILGLARRAGQAILGFETVEKALRDKPRPAVVIDAAEAAGDGKRKLQAAALSSGIVPFTLGCFSSEELGLALGRVNVVHAALTSGRMAERLIFEAGRLGGFRPLRPWVWTGFRAS